MRFTSFSSILRVKMQFTDATRKAGFSSCLPFGLGVNPPNVVYPCHVADYGARKPFSFLTVKLFVRLIRPKTHYK
jgi:hypothetical protein